MKKLILSLLFSLTAYASNEFAFDLYSKLEDGNIVFSPYGIFSNLALLKSGASGETAEEIGTILHISGKEDFHNLSSKLSIANGLFPHKGVRILDQFQKNGVEVFEAKIQTLNYNNPTKASETINRWISERTKGKIPQLLQEGDIDSNTRLVLANAVYFQGEWQSPFEPKATKKRPFYADENSVVDVEMLQQIHQFPYFENEEMQCLSLLFKESHLACVILLPKGSLNNFDLGQILEQSKPTLINAYIPKFCLTKRLVLNDYLKELGMSLPFSYDADFSQIDGQKDLFLTTVLHETYFSLNETGVTAASATTSHLGLKSVLYPSDKAISFIADHPFLFFILDTDSKTILFMGRMTNPLMGKCNEN